MLPPREYSADRIELQKHRSPAPLGTGTGSRIGQRGQSVGGRAAGKLHTFVIGLRKMWNPLLDEGKIGQTLLTASFCVENRNNYPGPRAPCVLDRQLPKPSRTLTASQHTYRGTPPKFEDLDRQGKPAHPPCSGPHRRRPPPHRPGPLHIPHLVRGRRHPGSAYPRHHRGPLVERDHRVHRHRTHQRQKRGHQPRHQARRPRRLRVPQHYEPATTHTLRHHPPGPRTPPHRSTLKTPLLLVARAQWAPVRAVDLCARSRLIGAGDRGISRRRYVDRVRTC